MVDYKIKNKKLDDLDLKLKKISSQKNEVLQENNVYKSAHIGWRMILELVIGIIMGVILGFGLDYFFNTTPIFLIIMIFFGFAAGVKTMIKTSQEINK